MNREQTKDCGAGKKVMRLFYIFFIALFMCKNEYFFF